MHRNRPRALHGNPTVDSNAGATCYREVNLLGGGEVDVQGSRDEFEGRPGIMKKSPFIL